jgi:hypothetical protein
MPIVSDEGRWMGAVRRYLVDQNGRIVGMTPDDERLAPADAPAGAGPAA